MSTRQICKICIYDDTIPNITFDEAGVCNYCHLRFDAGVRRENVLGFQFHPEKSHRFGMQLLKRFAEL